MLRVLEFPEHLSQVLCFYTREECVLRVFDCLRILQMWFDQAGIPSMWRLQEEMSCHHWLDSGNHHFCLDNYKFSSSYLCSESYPAPIFSSHIFLESPIVWTITGMSVTAVRTKVRTHGPIYSPQRYYKVEPPRLHTSQIGNTLREASTNTLSWVRRKGGTECRLDWFQTTAFCLHKHI